MKEIILVKMGELTLNGLNKHNFESALVRNVRYALEGMGDVKVQNAQSALYVVPQCDDFDMDEAAKRVGQVFGIVQYSRAAQVEKDFDTICKAAAEYLGEQLEDCNTFKVNAKRSDKSGCAATARTRGF